MIILYIYSWQTALLQEIRTFGACCQSSPCTGLICLQLCALQVFLKSDVCHRLFTGVFATAFPETDKPPLLRTHGSGIAKGNLIHTSSRLSTKKNRHAAMVCFESRFLSIFDNCAASAFTMRGIAAWCLVHAMVKSWKTHLGDLITSDQGICTSVPTHSIVNVVRQKWK